MKLVCVLLKFRIQLSKTLIVPPRLIERGFGLNRFVYSRLQQVTSNAKIFPSHFGSESACRGLSNSQTNNSTTQQASRFLQTCCKSKILKTSGGVKLPSSKKLKRISRDYPSLEKTDASCSLPYFGIILRANDVVGFPLDFTWKYYISPAFE